MVLSCLFPKGRRDSKGSKQTDRPSFHPRVVDGASSRSKKKNSGRARRTSKLSKKSSGKPKSKKSKKAPKKEIISDISRKHVAAKLGVSDLDNSKMNSFLTLQSEEEVDMADLLNIRKSEHFQQLAKNQVGLDSDMELFYRD